MSKTETAVAKRASLEVGSVIDYGDDAARGFENTTQADITLPFVSVLQDLSPQITGAKGNKVQGARAGLMINSVTGEMVESLTIVPAWHEHCFMEYVPRPQGGGFVGRHELGSPVVEAAKAASKEFGKYSTPAGNQLVETQMLYCVIVREDGRTEPAVLSFTSTKLKTFRNWFTRVNMFMLPLDGGRKIRPPLFAHLVRLSTKQETNKKGTFWNYALQASEKDDIKQSLLPAGSDPYLAAKSLQQMVKSGQAKADLEKETVDEAAPAETTAF